MQKDFQSNLSDGSLGRFQRIYEALQTGKLIEAMSVNECDPVSEVFYLDFFLPLTLIPYFDRKVITSQPRTIALPLKFRILSEITNKSNLNTRSFRKKRKGSCLMLSRMRSCGKQRQSHMSWSLMKWRKRLFLLWIRLHCIYQHILVQRILDIE